MSLNWKGAGKMRIGKTIGNKVVFLVFCFKKAIRVCVKRKKQAQHMKLELTLTHNLWNSIRKILKSALLQISARYRTYWYKSQLQGTGRIFL